jgi:cell division protein FtsB
MGEVIAIIKAITDSNTSLIAGAFGIFVAVIFIWMRVRNMTITEYDSTYSRMQKELESLRLENRALREEIVKLQARIEELYKVYVFKDKDDTE